MFIYGLTEMAFIYSNKYLGKSVRVLTYHSIKTHGGVKV
jgi:hypothetical protein